MSQNRGPIAAAHPFETRASPAMKRKKKRERLPDSPFYRQITRAVTVDDLQLGNFVGHAAANNEFPMRPPSEQLAIEMTHGRVIRPNDSSAFVRASFGIAGAFGDENRLKGARCFCKIMGSSRNC